jgi:hypothetical protein
VNQLNGYDVEDLRVGMSAGAASPRALSNQVIMSNAISVTLIGADLMGHGTGLAEWTPAQAEAVHNELASHLIKMTAR